MLFRVRSWIVFPARGRTIDEITPNHTKTAHSAQIRTSLSEVSQATERECDDVSYAFVDRFSAEGKDDPRNHTKSHEDGALCPNTDVFE